MAIFAILPYPNHIFVLERGGGLRLSRSTSGNLSVAKNSSEDTIRP